MAAKFEKHQDVYQLVIDEHDGVQRPMVVPVVISTVCPQRDRSFRYHVRTWEGVSAICTLGTFNVSEGSLFATFSEAARVAATIAHPVDQPAAVNNDPPDPQALITGD